MTQILHDNEFATFQYDESHAVLVLSWKAASNRLTDQRFKDEMIRYADLAMQHQVRGLLVDTRNFHFSMSEEVGEWRSRVVIPKYNEAGVRRFGFVVPGDNLPPSTEPRDGGPSYTTRFFSSREAAEAWVGDCQDVNKK